MGEALLAVSEEDDRRIFLLDTTSLYFESRESDAQVSELAEAWEEGDADPEAAALLRPRLRVVNEPALRTQGHNEVTGKDYKTKPGEVLPRR
ncbi:hypothetical protein D3C87_1288000 [compost metagenome]